MFPILHYYYKPEKSQAVYHVIWHIEPLEGTDLVHATKYNVNKAMLFLLGH